MRSIGFRLAAALGVSALAWPAQAQPPEPTAASVFDSVLTQPARLRVFLQTMPKGGDLHNHLWGQPYAEQFLEWSGEGGLCVSPSKLAIVEGPCKAPDSVPAKDLGRRDLTLYTKMIEALSTRGRPQGFKVNDITGHDDFFGSFEGFFRAAISFPGHMVASARRSAAANNVSYLELIQNPSAIDDGGAFQQKKPWRDGDFEANLAQIQPALPRLVDAAVAEIDKMEADAGRELKCEAASPPDACKVVVRYQAYALRSQSPQTVFGQMAVAFALAERDPRYVSVNIVAAEDGAVAVADFDLHMQMFRFFKQRYPGIKLSLHAGELDLGLVPPADLSDHIRQSIEVAGASRIGHGVDIAYEHDAPGLLALMARQRIAVEVNLTSNDTILGVRGARHPLALYRAAGVPFVLSTDDEGVSRSDMTNEYLRAATEQGLRYEDLKGAARASLEYAFLPGGSLWRTGQVGVPADACRDALAGGKPLSGTCATWLAGNEKARLQWRLEGQFKAFEQRIVTLAF